MKVRITGLNCVRETNGGGSDEPYVVTLAYNLRTGSGRTASQWDGDVDAGEFHANKSEIVLWTDVQHVHDVVIVAALIGSDRGGPIGDLSGRLTRREAESWMHSNSLPLLKQIEPGVRDHKISRAFIVDLMRKELVRAYIGLRNKHVDDLIGTVELKIDPNQISNGDTRHWNSKVQVLGRGGWFELAYEIESSTFGFQTASHRTRQAGIGSGLPAGNSKSATSSPSYPTIDSKYFDQNSQSQFAVPQDASNPSSGSGSVNSMGPNPKANQGGLVSPFSPNENHSFPNRHPTSAVYGQVTWG